MGTIPTIAKTYSRVAFSVLGMRISWNIVYFSPVLQNEDTIIIMCVYLYAPKILTDHFTQVQYVILFTAKIPPKKHSIVLIKHSEGKVATARKGGPCPTGSWVGPFS